jgi:tetratricopeptide (TPR) repeat protein
VALNRLGGHDGAALVAGLAGNAGLPPKIVTEIVERTDGVPLFVEELTKAVLESGDRNATLAASPSPELAIPASLHASLVARFDRLGPIAREVAQIGAVIGREFGYELIERVAERAGPELQTGLQRLSEAGLLFCRGALPQSAYLFKHALVQDAAYGTLLRTRRHELHARVSAALEQTFADLVERQPELLARHLTAAGDNERAVDQWLKAGRHAAERSGHLEAIRHFDRGLAALAALPEGLSRDGREIKLQLARGVSLFTTEGNISQAAAEAYARARELAEQHGDARQLFTAIYGLWQSTNGFGRVRESRGLSNQLLQLTADKADDGLLLQAHHSAWTTCFRRGEPAAEREHSEAGRRLYDPERHLSHRSLYGGHDPGVCAANHSAQAHWLLGYPKKAMVIGSEALALAERVTHPYTLGIALLYDAMLHLDRGDPQLALARLDAAEALAAEQRLGFVMEPRFLRGAALSAQGAFEDAVACLRERLAGPLGATHARPYALAETSVRQGEHGAALAAAREGLRSQKETGQGRWEAELHRLEGIALFGLNRLEEGQIALEHALRVAQRQPAKSYELRAATSFARLWGEQGQRAEAHKLLAPIYGWFTEGFDTADLRDAAILLSELA